MRRCLLPTPKLGRGPSIRVPRTCKASLRKEYSRQETGKPWHLCGEHMPAGLEKRAGLKDVLAPWRAGPLACWRGQEEAIDEAGPGKEQGFAVPAGKGWRWRGGRGWLCTL